MKLQQVINCMFSRWYSHFSDVTIDSRVIEIPTSVHSYLLADGLVLPSLANEQPTSRVGLQGDSDDDEDWLSEDADRDAITAPSFPEFEAQVNNFIKELGGIVFPKLDWSSPKDAVWISFGRTLQCSNLNDIVLLLKSSDFVTHDLTDPFDGCEKDSQDNSAVDGITYHLVLRKWQHIAPDSEFRCFVRDNCVVGISQRHQGVHFPSLSDLKQIVCDSILKFFDSTIKNQFPDNDFTFDISVKIPGDVLLVDFNPFGNITDSLLFSWEELYSDTMTSLQCRFVTNEMNIAPDPYRFYAVPQDFVHLTTGEDPAKFIDLLHLKIQSANDSSSDSEDDLNISGS